MERSEVCGGGGDEDEGKAFVLRFGVLLAFWEVESGEDRGTAAVEEVEGSVGDGWVAWAEESVADGVAQDSAFCVDSVHSDGDVGGEDVENGARRDRFDMRQDGGNGGAERYFLYEGICVKGGKRGERNGR